MNACRSEQRVWNERLVLQWSMVNLVLLTTMNSGAWRTTWFNFGIPVSLDPTPLTVPVLCQDTIFASWGHSHSRRRLGLYWRLATGEPGLYWRVWSIPAALSIPATSAFIQQNLHFVYVLENRRKKPGEQENESWFKNIPLGGHILVYIPEFTCGLIEKPGRVDYSPPGLNNKIETDANYGPLKPFRDPRPTTCDSKIKGVQDMCDRNIPKKWYYYASSSSWSTSSSTTTRHTQKCCLLSSSRTVIFSTTVKSNVHTNKNILVNYQWKCWHAAY